MIGRIEDFGPRERRECGAFLRAAAHYPTTSGLYAHVAAREDAPLGFACVGHNALTDGVYDLYWIAVDPDVERRGVGRVLLRRAEGFARGRGGRMMLIETSSLPSYRRQRAFYRKMGYRRVARIRDFFAAGDDKLVLRKDL